MKSAARMIGAILIIMQMLILPLYATPNTAGNGGAIHVVVAFHPDNLRDSGDILKAYESVLQEEGIPYECVNALQLMAADPGALIQTVPAILLPDGLAQKLPGNFAEWINRYVAVGGNVAVIYDAGTRDENGNYLTKAAFAEQIGVNYITYSTRGAGAFGLGNIQFSSEENRRLFQVPLGKTVDGVTVSSYFYGPLQYPIAKNQTEREIVPTSVFAYGITEEKERYPLLVLAEQGQGKILYVNLPLGYLKGQSDDLPMRTILRTFLFTFTSMPHVMNVPNGRGGLVINWHVDADIEHVSLPYLFKKGILRKELPSSIHITAGDFFLTPSDKAGFDAEHWWGRKLTVQLKEYGMIGSHGGWAHNWFSDNINSGAFQEKEIRENILRNNQALEKIIGYKVIEYAAPNGAHPQPTATKILEELGVIAYYYVGDTGSAPNRTFSDGKMVSDRVVAFPIMPDGYNASIAEMKLKGKKPPAHVAEWFAQTLAYVKDNRTVRLVYSHPYDYQHYPQTLTDFFESVVQAQQAKEITVLPMSEYAKFLLRFLKTSTQFLHQGNQMEIVLENAEGLEGITVALPKNKYVQPTASAVTVVETNEYYYLTMNSKTETAKRILVAVRH